MEIGAGFTILGVIIGGVVTYFVERCLQNRQLQKDEAKRKELLMCYLITLKNEIEDERRRLDELVEQIKSRVFLQEYFDVRIKEVILVEIVKMPFYAKNKQIFDRLNRTATKFHVLNQAILRAQEIDDGKYCSSIDQPAKLQQQRDIVQDLVADILIEIEPNNSEDSKGLSVEIDNIIKAL